MPKIIIDTNIIVSALAFSGRISNIIKTILNDDFDLVICKELELEIFEVLVDKFQVSLRVLEEARSIIEMGVSYQIKKPYPNICRDKKDNYLLALADLSKASVIITGDKDLLILKEYNNTKILKLSEFLEALNS